jgi:hypothetical protein
MEAFKIGIKLFAATDDFAHNTFVPIFHHWIQRQDFAGHMLIDVADYAHVIAGPGTVLVSFEANIHMERAENRLGLVYLRKMPLLGSFTERLAAVMKFTLQAAARMETEEELGGRLSFRTDEIVIRLNDRLLAPNTTETFAAVKDDLQAFGKRLFGEKPFTLEPHLSPQTLFEIRIKCPGAPGINAMLERLK